MLLLQPEAPKSRGIGDIYNDTGGFTVAFKKICLISLRRGLNQ